MNNDKIECPYCGIEITSNNYERHIGSKSCLKNQKYGVVEKNRCRHCGLDLTEFKTVSEKANHVKWCDKNPKRSEYNKDLSYARSHRSTEAWNKGLTKEIDNRVRNYSITNKNRYADGTNVVSYETRKKLQVKRLKEMKDQNTFCKRTFKKGKYKNSVYDSSWELAFQIYHDEHNIPMYKNETKTLSYVYEGFDHVTIPDFINENGKFIEIKGQIVTDKDKAKKTQTEHLVTYLFYSDISDMIKYVKSKYGKDFTELFYE